MKNKIKFKFKFKSKEQKQHHNNHNFKYLYSIFASHHICVVLHSTPFCLIRMGYHLE